MTESGRRHAELPRGGPETAEAGDSHHRFEFDLAGHHCAISCIKLCMIDTLIRAM